MYRFLLRPQWLAFHAAVLLLMPTFVLLGFWQLDRLDQRQAHNALVSANATATAVEVGALLRPGQPPAPDLEWRRTSAVGRYQPDRQLLLRNRPYRGRFGFWVLAPLVTRDGRVLLVNRGWVAPGSNAAATPVVPPPPAGEVSVVGRLRLPSLDQAPPAQGLPVGQTDRIDPLQASTGLGRPGYLGYLELTEQRPAGSDQPSTLPSPQTPEGPHLAYAVQWFLFTGLLPVGWWLLIRREGDNRR